MLVFVFLSNILLLTALISLLSNSLEEVRALNVAHVVVEAADLESR